MKLSVISDIHGDLVQLNEAKNIFKNTNLTIISGDLTKRGNISELIEVIDSINFSTNKLLTIPGNMDGFDSIKVMEEKNTSIHNSIKIIDNIGFMGVGGSTATPFGTPFELSEDEIYNILCENFEKLKSKNVYKTVVVCHNPPYNTKVDKVLLGRHVGSEKIRNFIEEKKPSVFLSGHIHEAASVDKINDTVLLNPGPFRRGGVGVVEILDNGKIEAEIVKVG